MARTAEERMARLAEQKRVALEKVKTADAQLKKLRMEQDRDAKKAARKARNYALIQTGILVEIAGLLQMDRGTLLGGLLALARSAEGTPEKAAQWKQAGDAEITRRETEKAKKTKPKDSTMDAATPTTTSRAIAP
ncbi:conjugal transfer protein TraD [Acidithiobacillus sp. IBUN Pt1247-S3]|uniref:conjugal transfer protein TraD n=1 Tax=Acidithiobacillus sp. IBUN Pt1247-S3 TaxID=3166642 RepID=UPI0034E466B4